MYTVKFLIQAELELTDACEWYERQKPGLAAKFLHEFGYYINFIANNPLHFSVNFSEKYRFAPLRKFPYSIVYRIDEENSVVVVSVFHQHRNPSIF